MQEHKIYLIINGIYLNSSRDRQFPEFCLGTSEVLNVYMGGKEMGGMIVGKGEKEGEERRREGD